jgi:hypothetical protein
MLHQRCTWGRTYGCPDVGLRVVCNTTQTRQLQCRNDARVYKNMRFSRFAEACNTDTTKTFQTHTDKLPRELTLDCSHETTSGKHAVMHKATIHYTDGVGIVRFISSLCCYAHGPKTNHGPGKRWVPNIYGNDGNKECIKPGDNMACN